MSPETIRVLTPEIVLVAVATLIYVAGAFVRARGVWSWVAAGGVLVAAIALGQQYFQVFRPGGGLVLSAAIDGPLAVDLFAQYFRWLALAVALLFVLMAARPAAGEHEPEFLGSLLLVVAGLMLAVSASDLVLLFLGLELISIPTYVLLFLGGRGHGSHEATAKYFFLSVLSSVLMLYGFSFLYGAAGSTSLESIAAALAAADGGALAGRGALGAAALVLVTAGFGFKIAVVPFHFYAPDVYQATTHPNAGLLAVVPKIAGLVALVRVAVIAMPSLATYGWRLALVLAIVTMTLGNVLALWQDNVRRLLAYSSIAHAGYMLIGVAVGFATIGGVADGAATDGIAAMSLYLVVYAIATTGVFAALTYLGDEQHPLDGVDQLAGLGRMHPIVALAIAVFMFSLAGIPPLAGFWGKLMLFFGALSVDGGSELASPMRWWFVALAVIGVLNAAVAAAYYLRIVAVMYFRQPLGVLSPGGGFGAVAAMAIAAVIVVAVGLVPGPLVAGANVASRSSQPAVVAASRLPDVSDAPALASDVEPSHGRVDSP